MQVQAQERVQVQERVRVQERVQGQRQEQEQGQKQERVRAQVQMRQPERQPERQPARAQVRARERAQEPVQQHERARRQVPERSAGMGWGDWAAGMEEELAVDSAGGSLDLSLLFPDEPDEPPDGVSPLSPSGLAAAIAQEAGRAAWRAGLAAERHASASRTTRLKLGYCSTCARLGICACGSAREQAVPCWAVEAEADAWDAWEAAGSPAGADAFVARALSAERARREARRRVAVALVGSALARPAVVSDAPLP